MAAQTFPCSYAQQRMWFLDRLSPGSGLYNIPAAVHLERGVDAQVLEQSVNELVRRHETLRTTFRDVEGEPQQVVAEEQALKVAVVDLRRVAEAEREAEALRLATEEARRPFDLERGPLLRVGLLQLSEQAQVLLITTHHIVSDGWSMEIFFRELASLYEAGFHGRGAGLSELPVQYADYAVWQREWLQGEELERQLEYWRRQLGGMEVLRLPTDRPRPGLASYEGSREKLQIDRATTAALKQLSQDENATLFMTLLTGFQMLLARYSGQQDIAVGTLTAGRTRAETEGLIGFFVNTLVLRTDVSGNPTFRELLRRVKETAIGAYGHAELPFEKLVEELQPQRDLSRNPLIQVTFQLFPEPPNSVGGTQRYLEFDRGMSTFDLALDVWESEGKLDGRIEYSKDLFDAATIRQMLRHLKMLVSRAAAHPDEAVERLAMMDADETHRQIVEWNETTRAYPRGVCIHEIFEAQSARSPDAQALRCPEVLTYDQLNRKANRIANALIREGVGRGSIVGIIADRSAETFAAMLGVLKAGAAYQPLDPAWPEERRGFMLRDAGTQMVISLPGVNTSDDESNPASGACERDLAYVLYTSGSTGWPKGVMVEHAALVNHSFACVERYGLDPTDRVLQFASLAFDVAAEEIFPTWAAGGCVVLSPKPAPLLGRLPGEAAGVTVMNLPAPYWREWVDSLEPGGGMTEELRLVITGSDRVDESRISRWFDRVGDRVRLIHAYGTTEATITSLTFEVTRDAWNPGAPLPVGRPLANVTAYVLDKFLAPVPAGVEGDIFLGGAGIARGYINHDSESFVQSPFGEGRLYRTGDRAYTRRDGNVVFTGRADGQMKIRGFRVEPAEVEQALREIPGVRDAAVALGDDSRLTAWVIADRPVDSAEAIGLLRNVLPDYMVPAAVAQVPALPRTSGGKLDRKGLPALDRDGGAGNRAYTEPVSGPERTVARIWNEALLTRVGIDDNFFELGGHSLLLLRVHSKLEAALRREIPIVELFRHPTVRSLAGFLKSGNLPSTMAATAVSRARLRKEAAERRGQPQT